MQVQALSPAAEATAASLCEGAAPCECSQPFSGCSGCMRAAGAMTDGHMAAQTLPRCVTHYACSNGKLLQELMIWDCNYCGAALWVRCLSSWQFVWGCAVPVPHDVQWWGWKDDESWYGSWWRVYSCCYMLYQKWCANAKFAMTHNSRLACRVRTKWSWLCCTLLDHQHVLSVIILGRAAFMTGRCRRENFGDGQVSEKIMLIDFEWWCILMVPTANTWLCCN